VRYLDRLRRSPTDQAPLLPVLRPHDWPLFVECVCRSLLTYSPGAGVPQVGLGRPRGRGFDMVRRDALADLGMSHDELEAFAVQNLSRLPTEWQVVHRNEATDRPAILGLPDEGSLTASRVLDRPLLERAHELIGARVLLVGMPSLHELFVCDGSPMADAALHKAFLIWLKRHYDAAKGVDPLSTSAFVVREGNVYGKYIPPDDG